MTEFDVHELVIISIDSMDEHFCVPAAWVNFVRNVTHLTKGLDYDTHVTMLNLELVEWAGCRHKVDTVLFPDAEHLTAFVLAWS